MKKLIFIIMIVLLAGCRTLKEYVYKSAIDTVYVNNILYDSIYIRDFIYQNNDTVYVNKYNYKYKFIKDTVYKAHIDTIYRDREITKTEYKTSNFSRFCVCGFFISIILLVVYILFKINKF